MASEEPAAKRAREEAPEDAAAAQRRAEAKQRSEAVWQQLNAATGGGKAGPGAALLAQLAKPKAPGSAKPAPAVVPAWRAALQPAAAAAAPVAAPQATPGLRGAAAAALAGAAAATQLPVLAAGGSDAVVVTESRRFAGQDYSVSRAYAPGSKAAQEALARTAPPRSGLDAALRAAESARAKLSALDKSRLDWAGAKAEGPSAEAEDLLRHARSADTYRGQQDFLARAAAAEEEREREARAAAAAKRRPRGGAED